MKSVKYFDNPEMQRYFESLPPTIQQNIVQSDVGVYSLEDLRTLANNLLKLGPDKK